MTTVLLIVLFVLDFILLGLFILGRRRGVPEDGDLAKAIAEERRAITEIRMSVKEELNAGLKEAKALMAKMAHIAAEVEKEIEQERGGVTDELKKLVEDLATQLQEPFAKIAEQQQATERLLKRVERQKTILRKMVTRGEKICNFFDDRVPYEEVLKEIEDKKYSDARQLLARGMSPDHIAEELGLGINEVRLIAGVNRL